MIAYIQGRFAAKSPSEVVVDVHGIGYALYISLHTFEAIQHKEEGLLYTHLAIREDAHLLYGFAEERERALFLSLISVSGIGANTARLMLSYMKPEEIIQYILQGDSRALERIKGIGKKTAERVVLELRDKLGKNNFATAALPAGNAAPPARHDALEALLALGIARAQAEQAIQKVLQAEPELALEILIKKSLKAI